MHVGVLQAKILQFQLISDATTFRECHDPTEILQYNGEKLTGPKNKACLVTGSGTCIILPGVVASFKMLKKRLLKKIEEDNKRSKGNTINSSASPPTLVVNAVKSIDEQRNHISIAITHWFQTHRDDLNCTENASLEEKTDYRIEFNSVNELAIVVCGCGTKATLGRANNSGNFQIDFELLPPHRTWKLFSYVEEIK
ncbi:unnamed protein product [Adineta ricciae]|uniref:Uncharacterized protein n=1 Tax=Adineta ricciae TaxID=249248 RepID=A0A815J650_ADIRI|nr:unnamed protein product [Adineta ricciae]